MSAVGAAACGGLGLLVLPVRRCPGDRLRAVLGEASRSRPSTGRLLLAGCVVTAVFIAISAGPVLATGAATAALAGWRGVRTVLERREGRRQEHVLLEAVSAITGDVRAGRSPATALAAAATAASGDVGRVLAEAAAAAEFGAEAGIVLATAGREASTSALSSGLVRLGAAWTVSARSGAAWSEVLDQVEHELRAQESHRQRMSAELAGSRATAVLLAGLPVVGLLLGSTLGADPVHVLFGTRGGRFALAAGLALEAAGLLWTARIIRSAQETA